MTARVTRSYPRSDATMRSDLWTAVGIALYLGVIVTLSLALTVSPWIAVAQATIIVPMLLFAWITK